MQVQLPFVWNTYLLFNSDFVKFVWEANEEEAESIALLIYALWWYFNDRWKRGGRVGRKIYLEPAECASFSCWDFSRSNSHDTFRHVVWSRYFYVRHCCFRFLSLGNLQKLRTSLPFPSLTFTINSHADNYFCKNVYLFQKLCSMKSFFFIKIPVKVCYIQIWLKCETLLLLFLIKTRYLLKWGTI